MRRNRGAQRNVGGTGRRANPKHHPFSSLLLLARDSKTHARSRAPKHELSLDGDLRISARCRRTGDKPGLSAHMRKDDRQRQQRHQSHQKEMRREDSLHQPARRVRPRDHRRVHHHRAAAGGQREEGAQARGGRSAVDSFGIFFDCSASRPWGWRAPRVSPATGRVPRVGYNRTATLRRHRSRRGNPGRAVEKKAARGSKVRRSENRATSKAGRGGECFWGTYRIE